MAGYLKTKQPCEDCGSSDARAVNGDGSSFCFSCRTRRPPTMDLEEDVTPTPSEAKKAAQKPSDGFLGAFPDRRIGVQTATEYGVTQNDRGDVHFPYYNAAGDLVGVKTRKPSKDFFFDGDNKDATLFGQSRFSAGGRYVTITEGEFDAMAAYQMLSQRHPVVSIRNGAQSALKDCKAQFQWLDSFDEIIICFDSDEPGRRATKEVAELFGSKARMFKHRDGYKDACDWLANKDEGPWVTAWNKSEAYKPEGIVTIADIKERLLTPPKPGVNWCFDTLTELTYGRRPGELYAFGAGVGVGKTDVFTQQIAYDIDTLGLKVGVIYLEQNVVETAQRVMGKLDKRLYHVPDADWTREQFERSVDELDKRGQLYMFEHFGAMEWRVIKNIIRFFAKAYDIQHIYLDHLTALSANEQDERRALDGIMADMASIAQELGIVIHFISHLTTPDGKAHEEGGRVMEKHFTGSRAIARWSHYMFGLERDKQAEDVEKRQTTTFRVLKDRFTGRGTGMKFGIKYNKDTGILSETTLIEEDDEL